MKHIGRTLAVAAVVVLHTLAASAQEANIDIQRFVPAVTHDGFVMVEGSDVRPEEDRWDLGAFINYGFRPLVVADADNNVVTNFVAHRLAFDLMGSVTVVGPFAIGLGIPFVLTALVMVGRVYVGAHNPLDTTAGLGAGLILGGIVASFIQS